LSRENTRYTVLIVDDSKSIRLYLKYIIEGIGFNVLSAEDGKEALELQKDPLLKLVITDLEMPIMDGFEFVEEFKRNPEYKFIPVVFLSSNMEMEKRKKAKQLGAVGWLEKPIDAGKILKILSMYIR
jgi:two-component system, chemotaxis family, chemotaxis protein CheY